MENGEDKILSLPYRIVLDLLSIIGFFRKAWKFFDQIHGRFTYNFQELLHLVDSYDKVILVQASSWGFQDAVLAYQATVRKWRTVLIPYTTDQLFCNGYLYSEFDKVCVQGSLEEKYALDLHKIQPFRIEKLGSAYIRFIESSTRINQASRQYLSPISKTIMYAGISPQYFPSDLELKALRSLSSFMRNELGRDWKIIYRPVVTSANQYESLLISLYNCKNIEIAPSNASMLGLSTKYTDSSAADDVMSLVKCLKEVDLLICSSFTSMVIDAAICGVPSLSYFPLNSRFFERRKYKFQLNEACRAIDQPSVPLAKILPNYAT